MLILRLINPHVYGEILRMEVKEDCLLLESEIDMSLTHHLLNIIVDCLFKVQGACSDPLGMSRYSSQSLYSFLKFEVGPPLLNTVAGSLLDYHFHGLQLASISEEPSSHGLLYP